MIGSILVVIGFLLGAGSTNYLSNSSDILSLLYVGGISILICSVLIDYMAIRLSRVYYVPNLDAGVEIEPSIPLETKMANPEDIPYIEIIRINIRNIAKIINRNQIMNGKKARLISYSWITLILGLTLVILFILISVVSNTTATLELTTTNNTTLATIMD